MTAKVGASRKNAKKKQGEQKGMQNDQRESKKNDQ